MLSKFNLGSLMAPIGKPISVGGMGGGKSNPKVGGGFMPQPAFDPSNLQKQIAGLQKQIGGLPSFDPSQFATKGDLENRPIYDDTALRDQITSIAQRPGFDDSALRQMIEANANRPSFDPSKLQSRIGGIEDRLSNLPQFDDSGLRQMIEANKNRPQFDPSQLQSGIAGLQERIQNLPQFDPSQLQDRLKTLESREAPKFNPQDFRDDFLNIAREGIQMPEYQAPDLSGFARKEDIPQFDRQKLIEEIQSGINIPQPQVPDMSAFESRFADMQKRIEELSQNQINQQLPLGNTGSEWTMPEPDPVQYPGGSADFNEQGPTFDPRQMPAAPIVQEPIGRTPAPTLGGSDFLPNPGLVGRPGMDRPGQQPISIGGPGGGITSIQQPLQPEGQLQMSPDGTSGLIGGPNALIPDVVDTGFMPQPATDFQTSLPVNQAAEQPLAITDNGPDNIGGAPSLVGQQSGETSPMTTANTQIPTGPNQIDPVLLQQETSEQVGDPLLRSLYFGTADSPGFYNQLQQAGANLIGSDVPLQQTAGLSPLELLARKQAVAGLGGFEPFLQQNRDLVNQAIEQSRRAESLQDPYYSQAEEIFKDTMGAYDPSMTQQFYNPYEDAVVQQTIDDVMKAGDKQDISSRAREISSGAFGGSRARLGAEERRESLGKGLAQALGNIRSQGFQSAQQTGLSEFARQQQAKRTGAQGLMGIGVGRGSAAASLGAQLAGYGGQMSGIGQTQEGLRSGQRGELAGYGGIGRGIAETGLGRIFEQQVGQQYRPMQTLGQIAGMLPGYQASGSTIDSSYGMPTDPTAAGLGAAFSAYGAMAPRQGQS